MLFIWNYILTSGKNAFRKSEASDM